MTIFAQSDVRPSILRHRPKHRVRQGFVLVALSVLVTLGGCAGATKNARPLIPTCQETITIDEVIDRRTLRLSDGKIVELTVPQLFLQAPSPEQPDYFSLNEELVAFLKKRLEGETLTADRSGASVSLCGQDRVAVGTALVSQGFLYVEQAAGPVEATSREQWARLEASARQKQRGLWKNGTVGPRVFDRVARLTFDGLTAAQHLDEISYDGIVPTRGRTLTPQNIEQLHTVVSESAIVIMPRSTNFWQLCCSVSGAWFRVYYPRKEGETQAADYIESPQLATFFRRIFKN